MEEEQPEDMYRCTLGTGISDRNKHYSFTLYVWSNEPFDSWRINQTIELFEDCLVLWLKREYPNRNYNISDWWGGVIIREEVNALVDYDHELVETYSFEVNQYEEENGPLWF